MSWFAVSCKLFLSVQAQSTDIQPHPEEVFEHSLHDFQQLSALELEHLGRLNTSLSKAAGEDRYKLSATKKQELVIDGRLLSEPNFHMPDLRRCFALRLC